MKTNIRTQYTTPIEIEVCRNFINPADTDPMKMFNTMIYFSIKWRGELWNVFDMIPAEVAVTMSDEQIISKCLPTALPAFARAFLGVIKEEKEDGPKPTIQ